MIITPKPLIGTVKAPPSKSYAIRYLLAAFLSGEETLIRSVGTSGDVLSAISAVTALGAECKRLGEDIVVSPKDSFGKKIVDCGESATVYRLCLAVFSALGKKCEFSIAPSLQKRPNNEYIALLNAHGAGIDGAFVTGKLKSGRYEVSGDISTQYLSGLIMSLPLLDGDSDIVAQKDLVSSPYVEMTISTIEKFGVKIEKTDKGYHVFGGQRYISPKSVDIEGDFSAAANLFALGALSGEVTVTNLNLNSLQGDKIMIDVLRDFGASVFCGDDSVTVKKCGNKPIIADFSCYPDIVPAASALCARAEGESIMKNISRLKYKETDRIASIIAALSATGVKTALVGSDLHVFGGSVSGANYPETFDHRTLMLQTILASCAKTPSTIQNQTCVNKSYPDFFEAFASLGGKIDE